MISLDEILHKGYLRKVHEDIRKDVRQSHLTQALLVKDPTLLCDFQYELDDALRLLRQDVLHNRYRTERVITVHAAKSSGLRRPLAFLQHEDAVLLTALSRATRTGIVQAMPRWVSFGRTDNSKTGRRQTEARVGLLEPESGNWFFEWMRYRGLLRVVANDPGKFLVESDVANFFPYLDLEILRQSFTRAGFLDHDATNLIFFLLEQLMVRDKYGPRSKLGLPQEPYDASRILAHYYLTPLDDELKPEGQRNRYTRWVDDIAVSVADELEGAQVIARIQDSLRRIGLSPNTQKTRIISKQKFREEHWERYNGFLDVAQRRTDSSTVDARFRRTFDEWLQKFLKEKPHGRWDRVLRRFYTQSRRMGNAKLTRLAASHLETMPEHATHILDYLCFRSSSENSALVGTVFDILAKGGRLYEDTQILCYEWLLTAPFPDDPILRARVTHLTYSHLLGRDKFSRAIPYARGVMAFVILKFGGERALGRLCSVLEEEADLDREFTLNALYVLTACTTTDSRAWSAVEHVKDPYLWRLRRFLDAIRTGDRKAVGIALGLITMATTALPTRAIFRARALPLLYLLKRDPAVASRLKSVEVRNSKALSNTEVGLRDYVMEAHF